MLPKKTTLAIVTFGALVLLLNLTKLARPFTPSSALDFRPRRTAEPIEPLRSSRGVTSASKPVIMGPNLIDPHQALKAFYQALWRTESGQPGAITRVLHYGDSPVTASPQSARK